YRMYRTGDRGKWDGEGAIAFLGRIDQQLKIRGYRIEPGEIENTLGAHPDIDAAIVSVWQGEEGEPELTAYFVSNWELNGNELRAYLSKSLPSYMLPVHFIRMTNLPLTANGKVDRKALPAPESRRGLQAEYAPPTNDRELALVEVFMEVLKKEKIGIKDDFFALGGDSIKSILIVSRLKQRGYSLAIQEVLLHPVVEDLAIRMKVTTMESEQGIVEGNIPLSPIQEHFFRHYPDEPRHYNQSVLLESAVPIAIDGLRAALEKILLHHDALRMVFRRTAGGWIQENKGAEQGYDFELIEYGDAETFYWHCERIQSSIDLEKGPLLKAALFRGPKGDRLLLVVHHLVIDGVSWRVLFEDLSALYAQYMAGDELQLPMKTTSFRQWQEGQVDYAESDALAAEELYWMEVDSALQAPLPVDVPEGSNTWEDAAVRSVTLDESITGRLLTQCFKAYQTDINVILLTALGGAVRELLGVERLAVNVEGHGRESIGTELDISRTIGWFTAIYPVVVGVGSPQDIIAELIGVKETMLGVPNKGIGYGILRYLAKKALTLDPAITFNYLGDFGSGVEAPEERLFSYSGDFHGKEIAPAMSRDSLLYVSGMQVEGRIRLSIRYSARQFHESTINQLLSTFKGRLEQLVDVLSQESGTRLTPSDLTYKGLTMDDLELLNRL
ncbi:MAG: non-ribosomal peptide synthetase, partial [Bacteroidetes bacterium]|nr:non-ribosomal peptide synthetase [Bacteroidota bacterium]